MCSGAKGCVRPCGTYRKFKRYFATEPSGLHPLGCGGHRPPPSLARVPTARAAGWSGQRAPRRLRLHAGRCPRARRPGGGARALLPCGGGPAVARDPHAAGAPATHPLQAAPRRAGGRRAADAPAASVAVGSHGSQRQTGQRSPGGRARRFPWLRRQRRSGGPWSSARRWRRVDRGRAGEGQWQARRRQGPGACSCLARVSALARGRESVAGTPRAGEGRSGSASLPPPRSAGRRTLAPGEGA